ncbi:sensor histidine kinase [Siculibacillus lacustris]|uniref:sensor histidine kinase n=1 Tax=Siculibacillus lacustris TaxID=1549641 RepID=UPI0013F16C90|nr:CHASE3 domain-containing protein [Siculibacillus lacustris]
MSQANEPGLLKFVDRRFLGYNVLMALVAAAILLTIAVGSFVFGERTQEQSAEALRAAATDRAALAVLASLVDAETGQRGWLLTGDDDYLKPYTDARTHFPGQLEQFRLQVERLSNDVTIPDPARLEDVARRKFDELAQTLALARTGDRDGAFALVRSDVGITLMDEARAYVAQVLALTDGLRLRRIEQMRASARLLTVLTSLGVVTILVLSVLAILLITHHTRELEVARRDLARSNEALEHRVRDRTRELLGVNAEVQRYAYIVSHDLRAPLVNIMGFTSELETATSRFSTFLHRGGFDRTDPIVADVHEAVDVDIPEALGFIRTSTTRMDALINEILKLSRLGRVPLVPEAIVMETLLRDCIATVQHRLDAGGATAMVISPLPRIVSDANSLNQIFTNLLDNAAKYFDPARPGRIVIRGRTEGANAIFSVEDNGRGIAAGDHERIFELFRRSGAQDRPGEGIGLAHVRSLVRRLGGDIGVVSDGSTGTIFRLILPIDLRPRLKKDTA